MKLEQKYFLPFVAVITIFLLFVIAVYTFDYSEKQQASFMQKVQEKGILDTLHIVTIDSRRFILSDSMRKPATVLVFWAGWSEKSISFLKTVVENNPDTARFEVIGLLVKDHPAEVQAIMHEIPGVTWAMGTAHYGSLLVPGVPSAISWQGGGKPVKAISGNNPDSVKVLFSAGME
jgi:hypothetical protein